MYSPVCKSLHKLVQTVPVSLKQCYNACQAKLVAVKTGSVGGAESDHSGKQEVTKCGH